MKFCVFGDDARQRKIIELYKCRGIEVLETEQVDLADVIIFPTPLHKEGSAFRALAAKGHNGLFFAGAISPEEENIGRDLKLFDYTKEESFSLLNALPSAEGALLRIMLWQKKVLQGSAIAILGYGRIAKQLARMLFSLGCDISIFARREDSRAEAEATGLKAFDYDQLRVMLPLNEVIVNTVPSKVIGKDDLSCLKTDTYLLDLASAPGGISISEAESLGFAIEWIPGLPALYSPNTAAEYVIRTIENLLRRIICTIKK